MRKLTILMPTFNSAKSVRRSINNILLIQADFELIIADGGSTDGTVDIIESFEDVRIKLKSRRDSGLYYGINSVISSVTGEYVQFINSDDFINHKYVELAIDILDAHRNYHFVYGGIIKGGEIIKPRSKNWYFDYQYMPFPHISLLVRRELFLEFTPFNTEFRISSDCDFVWKLKESNAKGYEIINVIAATVDPGGISDGWMHLVENLFIAKSRRKNFFLRNSIFIFQFLNFKLRKL